MKKQTMIVGVSITALLALILVLLYLNGSFSGNIESRVIFFYDKGEEIATIDEEYLLKMPGETFKAVIRSSGKKPEDAEFEGVEVSKLFEELNIETEGKEQILFRAADGYVSALSLDEVLTKDNTYIAYKMNGEQLKTKSQGGNGPFQLIIKKDPFSQRWCKYLQEVELQ